MKNMIRFLMIAGLLLSIPFIIKGVDGNKNHVYNIVGCDCNIIEKAMTLDSLNGLWIVTKDDGRKSFYPMSSFAIRDLGTELQIKTRTKTDEKKPVVGGTGVEF